MEFNELNAKYFGNEIKLFVHNLTSGISLFSFSNTSEVSVFFRGYKVGVINNIAFYDYKKVNKQKDDIDSDIQKGIYPKTYKPQSIVIFESKDSMEDTDIDEIKEIEDLFKDDSEKVHDDSNDLPELQQKDHSSEIVDVIKEANDIWKILSLNDRILLIKNLISIDWLDKFYKEGGKNDNDSDLLNLL
ncbi:MAG: hypothetical protein KatS3mg027_2345 [Bacteroidia bacterium]|nr:MAG: hypothetical protein KatS3mg027_2345 [Bacteroidia bacterium]